MSEILEAVTLALADMDNCCRGTHFILRLGDGTLAIPVPQSSKEHYRTLLQRIGRLEVARLQEEAFALVSVTLCEAPEKKCNHTFFVSDPTPSYQKRHCLHCDLTQTRKVTPSEWEFETLGD